MEVTNQIGLTTDGIIEDTEEITVMIDGIIKDMDGIMGMLDNTTITTHDTLDIKEIIISHLTVNQEIQFTPGEIMLDSPTFLLDPTSSLLEDPISKLLIKNY